MDIYVSFGWTELILITTPLNPVSAVAGLPSGMKAR
jgi:hypothetical protein